MPNYNVIIDFESKSFDVEANNEDEAVAKAHEELEDNRAEIGNIFIEDMGD